MDTYAENAKDLFARLSTKRFYDKLHFARFSLSFDFISFRFVLILLIEFHVSNVISNVLHTHMLTVLN